MCSGPFWGLCKSDGFSENGQCVAVIDVSVAVDIGQVCEFEYFQTDAVAEDFQSVLIVALTVAGHISHPDVCQFCMADPAMEIQEIMGQAIHLPDAAACAGFPILSGKRSPAMAQRVPDLIGIGIPARAGVGRVSGLCAGGGCDQSGVTVEMGVRELKKRAQPPVVTGSTGG